MNPLDFFKPGCVYTLDRLYDLTGAESVASLDAALTALVEQGKLTCNVEVVLEGRVIHTLPRDVVLPEEVYDEGRGVDVPTRICDTPIVFRLA